jgi:hypothetical protein
MVSPGMFLRKPLQHGELDGCHGNHARRFIVTASPERPPLNTTSTQVIHCLIRGV